MKAPREMWIDGVKYDEGDRIPVEYTRTAKVLLDIADTYKLNMDGTADER